MAPPNIKVAQGDEQKIKDANQRVKNIKTKITVLVQDGKDFPSLQEIKTNMEVADPASSQVFKEYGRANAKAKVVEVQGLLTELESSCNNFKALTMSLGGDHNSKEVIQSAVADIEASDNQYKTVGTNAIKALAPYTVASVPTSTTQATAATPRTESNKFSKISSTAEPSNLPRDVSPSDFNI